MNYELAKKLKDAGFPQGEVVCQCIINPCRCQDNFGYIPTLSELIDALGNGLQFLSNNHDSFASNFPDKKGGWIAGTNRKNEIGERMEFWGETPIEAVVNLWITLNNK